MFAPGNRKLVFLAGLAMWIFVATRLIAHSYYDPRDVLQHTRRDFWRIAIELEDYQCRTGKLPIPTEAGTLPSDWADQAETIEGDSVSSVDEGKQVIWKKSYEREGVYALIALTTLLCIGIQWTRGFGEYDPGRKASVHFRMALWFTAGLFLALLLPGFYRSPSFDMRIRPVDNPDYESHEHDYFYVTDGSSWFLLQGVGCDGDRDFLPTRMPELDPKQFMSLPAIAQGNDSTAPTWMIDHSAKEDGIEVVDGDVFFLWIGKGFDGFHRSR